MPRFSSFPANGGDAKGPALSQQIVTMPRVQLLVGCFGFNGPLRQYFSLYRAVSQREGEKVGWLVGFGFNGPLRQYFSLYRAVSQREGERGKK